MRRPLFRPARSEAERVPRAAKALQDCLGPRVETRERTAIGDDGEGNSKGTKYVAYSRFA